MGKIELVRHLLSDVKGKTLSNQDRSELAVQLASLILEEANDQQTREERNKQKELHRMMRDPVGKFFINSLTDQCFRSENSARSADQIIYLLKKFGIPRFLSFPKKLLLLLFRIFGRVFPKVLVPIFRNQIRKETEPYVISAEKKELEEHLLERAREGIRINLNHLGEAILGENEALHRKKMYLDDLANPLVNHISVKISTIYSQINLLGWEETLSTISERFRELCLVAMQNSSEKKKFIYLDMEEYKDLSLTVACFCKALEDPQLHYFSAGIVLQSYIPESFTIQQDLTKWAKNRIKRGGAPIKIRLVKGANLAMERVESSLRDWPLPTYDEKLDSDANFKKMVLFGTEPENAEAVQIGIGSHNLFDIAFGLILRAERDVKPYVSFEMLEGMANSIRRVVQQLTGDILLYCPDVSEDAFQNAIAYLVRRLDENTAPENFLRNSFGLQPGTKEWIEQEEAFKNSIKHIQYLTFAPNRVQDRSQIPHVTMKSEFKNEPDTDWCLLQNISWAEKIVSEWSKKQFSIIPLVVNGEEIYAEKQGKASDPAFPEKTLYQYSLLDEKTKELALKCASENASEWDMTPLSERGQIFSEIAQELRKRRDRLIGAMMADTGKTVSEADVEVSEAIDFAEYYRRTAEEMYALKGISWMAKGTVLVTPPWNFPCSIPASGILAALIAGNAVLFKPAHEAVLVGWELAQIFWAAGVSKKILQFIPCEETPTGNELIQDKRISMVVLTGSTETAKHFLKLRPGLDLAAETGGKNAIIVTSMADRDLAIKDIIQSAFGHAGQKCSACSLLICEKEVYDDPQFRKQLRDAASSLSVGTQWNLSNKVNPLIHEPNPNLLRGLTTLENGEEWLLKPIQNKENPNNWSPGIKMHVQAGSFTHQTELFGPVLAMMRANNLSHAIHLANDTPYGLTSGLHSLDEREQKYWIENIVAGNCYINRGITGAIVRRQPFGGAKQSTFGRGSKAGGPNYVSQMMIPIQKKKKHLWNDSIDSYKYYWDNYFNLKHDPSHVLGEENLFQYRPHEKILFRIQKGDEEIDILRVIEACKICGTNIEISSQISLNLNRSIKATVENDLEFCQRIQNEDARYIRLLSNPSQEVQNTLAKMACNVLNAPVLAHGRLELLNYLREVCVSNSYHRYGFLTKRELKK